MSTKKQTKKRPSRLKYEQANPTVPFRLPRETYGQLVSHIQVLWQSFGDWMKNHLDQDDARARARAEAIKLMLQDFGIEEERFRLEWISASESRKFAQVVTDMVGQIKQLGPSPYKS